MQRTAITAITATATFRGVTWGYYTPTRGTIWDAPEAIPEVCYAQNSKNGGPCNSTEFTTHVHVADQNGYSDAPIFDDLYNCNLPSISWVIPDKVWSDHPLDGGNANSTVYGPSWVGDIIDAVGGGMSGSTCNPPSATNAKYWVQEPTAILVVWDDWGGWFDHVSPWAVYRGSAHSCTGDAPNNWGCGYTSGFRVPFLVVSPYTGTVNAQTYSSYVSGACGASPLPPCPNFGTDNVYVHDFGSILDFTEYNFNMPFIDNADNGYADYNAPDRGQQHNKTALLDFFPLSTARPFVSITTEKDCTFFQKYYQTTATPATGPDDDNNSD